MPSTPPLSRAPMPPVASTPPVSALYRAILQSHPAGLVFLSDRERRFRLVEGRMLREGQIDSADLIGRTVDEVWPEQAAQLNEQLRRAFAGEETVEEVTRDGRVWRVRMLAVHDESGHAEWVLARANDVTRTRTTELALASSELRVRRILEELPGPVLALDLDHMSVDFVNAAFCDLLDESESSLRALGADVVSKLVHPDDLDFIMGRFAALFAAADGEVIASRFRGRRADGVWLHVHTRNVVFARHPNGRPRTMLTVITDESDRHAAFEALTEAARRLREAQQIGHMGSWEWDIPGGGLTWSEEMFSIWNIDPAQGAPDYRAFLATIPEPDRSDMVDVLTTAINSGAEAFRLEHRVTRADGLEPRIQCRGSIRRDASGRALTVAGTSQDVTELRLALEAARTSEERYRLAAAATNDVLYDHALIGGDRVIWNAAIGAVFGYTLDETHTTSFGWWLERVHPDDRSRVGASLAAAISAARQHWSEEYRFRKADGQYAVVLDNGYLMPGPDGAIQRIIGSMTDDTARRALDTRLRQTAKLDALGTLAGGIAHDFNNILAGIVGFADLARDDVQQHSEVAEYLAEITAATRRARDLVRQILTFSRKDDARRVPVPLTPLVEETRRLIRATFPSTVDIQVDIQVASADATPLVVEADSTLLQQSLLNLCMNAEYAMRGRQERVLQISLTEEHVPEGDAVSRGLRAGVYAAIRVHDTGIGMSPDVVERVFEPFFTTKPVGEGTGLGLAMVHGAVTSIGGAVEIHSTVGTGTSVTMLLPLVDARDHAERADHAATTTRPLRVLVVDDEPMIRKVLTRLLERLHHVPLVVPTPDAAHALIADQSQHIDVLLTDQTMPGMTGDALARAAKQLRPQLSVVLMTGYTGNLKLAELAEIGVTALLEKPIDAERLATTLAGIASR